MALVLVRRTLTNSVGFKVNLASRDTLRKSAGLPKRQIHHRRDDFMGFADWTAFAGARLPG
jgi:hypothetical protein